VVDSYYGSDYRSRAQWLCICDCGNTKIANSHSLTKGEVKSCGCLLREHLDTSGERLAEHNTVLKANYSDSTEVNTTKKWEFDYTYSSYNHMISRCHNPSDESYTRYGGIGIFVCDRWRESFSNFIEDMGKRPRGCSIDRIDGLLGYSLENCRWADIHTQNNNKKTNVTVEIEGVRYSVKDISQKLNVHTSTILHRIKMGRDVCKTLRRHNKS